MTLQRLSELQNAKEPERVRHALFGVDSKNVLGVLKNMLH